MESDWVLVATTTVKKESPIVQKAPDKSVTTEHCLCAC